MKSYQTKTGTLSSGAHPGSYNGQDAYNDMLVTNGIRNAEIRRVQGDEQGNHVSAERLQERNRLNFEGGVEHEQSQTINAS